MSAAIIGWALQTGLMISVLIVFVLLARRPVARIFGAKAAYALWMLPVLRLALPSIAVPYLNLPRFLTAKPAEPALAEFTLTELPVFLPSLDAPQTAPSWPAVLIALWAVIAAGFVLYHALRQAEMQDRLHYGSQDIDGDLREMATEAAQDLKLKDLPKIRLAEGNVGPLVCRLFPPVIYLPEDFAARFTPQQQRYALLHEMAHIKRRDLWAAWAWLVFRAANWPNPLVHVAARSFRADQEAACDASVIKLTNGKDGVQDSRAVAAYAETLLQAAQSAAKSGRASPSSSQLALTIHQPLKERLLMLNTRTQKPHWLARAGAAAMIIAAFGLTAPLTQAEGHPDEELAGKADKHTSKSVMKFVTDKDGKEVKKHFEITIDGDDVKAIEIDEDGNVTRINPDDIEGFDLGAMRGSKAWAFSLDEDMKLEFLDSVKAAQRMGGVDLSFLEDMDLAEMLESAKGNKFVFRGQNGDIQSFEFPTPPTPPKGLKALRLKKETDFDVEAMQLGAQMQAARSMLEAAEDMIREAEATAQNGKKASKAQRELAKARKALRDAEKALSEE